MKPQFNFYNADAVIKVVRDIVDATGKSLVDVLNRTGRAVAFELLKLTRRTERSRILAELGQIVVTKTISKTGKVRNKKSVVATRTSSGAPLLALLVNAKRHKEGQPGLKGSAMETAMRKFLGARLRTAGFARVGSLGEIHDLAPFVKGSVSTTQFAKQFGSQKGHAIAATENNNRVTLISDIYSKKTQSLLAAIVNAPIQSALNNVEADKRRWLEERLAKDVTRK
jgi:hypothetical protein